MSFSGLKQPSGENISSYITDSCPGFSPTHCTHHSEDQQS